MAPQRDPVSVVHHELVREFGDHIDEEELHVIAAMAVAHFSDARVRDYVVALALRSARAHASELQPVGHRRHAPAA